MERPDGYNAAPVLSRGHPSKMEKGFVTFCLFVALRNDARANSSIHVDALGLKAWRYELT
eukprot:6019848-Amphidinium_carterae.1